MKKESGFVPNPRHAQFLAADTGPHTPAIWFRSLLSAALAATCEGWGKRFLHAIRNPSRSSAVEIERGGAQHRRQRQASYQVTRTLKRGQQSITHCGGPSSKQCRQHKEMTLATMLRLPRRFRQRPRAPSQFLPPVVRHE